MASASVAWSGLAWQACSWSAWLFQMLCGSDCVPPMIDIVGSMTDFLWLHVSGGLLPLYLRLLFSLQWSWPGAQGGTSLRVTRHCFAEVGLLIFRSAIFMWLLFSCQLTNLWSLVVVDSD